MRKGCVTHATHEVDNKHTQTWYMVATVWILHAVRGASFRGQGTLSLRQTASRGLCSCGRGAEQGGDACQHKDK